jgi:high affinity cGMP-specific 3',5'-cyclic phosphodiesterase 9
VILLHTADLFTPIKPFHVAREWAVRQQQEFNEQVRRCWRTDCRPPVARGENLLICVSSVPQVEMEKRMGLPSLPFMEGTGEMALCKGEIGYIAFVIKPWCVALLAPTKVPTWAPSTT